VSKVIKVLYLYRLHESSSTSVDIGVSANQELVDKFCYFGDILSVDGDTDAAVEARIQIGWNKFRLWYHCFTAFSAGAFLKVLCCCWLSSKKGI